MFDTQLICFSLFLPSVQKWTDCIPIQTHNNTNTIYICIHAVIWFDPNWHTVRTTGQTYVLSVITHSILISAPQTSPLLVLQREDKGRQELRGTKSFMRSNTCLIQFSQCIFVIHICVFFVWKTKIIDRSISAAQIKKADKWRYVCDGPQIATDGTHSLRKRIFTQLRKGRRESNASRIQTNSLDCLAEESHKWAIDAIQDNSTFCLFFLQPFSSHSRSLMTAGFAVFLFLSETATQNTVDHHQKWWLYACVSLTNKRW